jgi:hypothetical protein
MEEKYPLRNEYAAKREGQIMQTYIIKLDHPPPYQCTIAKHNKMHMVFHRKRRKVCGATKLK